MESIFTCYTRDCPVTFVVYGHGMEHQQTFKNKRWLCQLCGEELSYVDRSTNGWLHPQSRPKQPKEAKQLQRQALVQAELDFVQVMVARR